jgi:hypothetical protein
LTVPVAVTERTTVPRSIAGSRVSRLGRIAEKVIERNCCHGQDRDGDQPETLRSQWIYGHLEDRASAVPDRNGRFAIESKSGVANGATDGTFRWMLSSHNQPNSFPTVALRKMLTRDKGIYRRSPESEWRTAGN